ncbi:unnamed protein product [Urochloa decumbens]|uniref:Uncharacterized protein n=1 Tax=Urochloa decumbens TaxID=240449 RepID=A0ABC9DYG8_9POAL
MPSSGGCRSTLSAEILAGFPLHGHHETSSASQPISSSEKDTDPICCSCCCASPALLTSNLITPLVESLHKEFQQLIDVRLEELLRPLREEASTIKLWLARVANHLECDGIREEHTSIPNMAELFGPYSPVRRSPTPSILTSLAAACKPTDSLVCEDTCANISDSGIDNTTVGVPIVEIHKETCPITNDEAACLLDTEKPIEQDIEVPSRASTSQMHPDSPIDQKLVEAASSIEEFVLVEDASDDEEATSDIHVAVEDPIFLITIEEGPIQSTFEIKEEEARLPEDPSIQEMSSVAITARKGEEPTCLPLCPSSPLTTTARRRPKSYDRSSLRRSAHLAQLSVLKDLGIVGNDGKLKDDAIQEYADRLKECLPPELLKPLMGLKGRAFWDFVAKVSLPLR